ncbi:hypothetical protein J7M23_05305 [Candidatus Sumerlaeota bacterium]|nr:hypothetical protein [Candidatus Sumerlaeota bacterium]
MYIKEEIVSQKTPRPDSCGDDKIKLAEAQIPKLPSSGDVKVATRRNILSNC